MSESFEIVIDEDASITVYCPKELEAEIRRDFFSGDFPGGTDDVKFVYTD
jgi:hypothetical protein